MSQEKDIHEAMKKGWVGPLMALNRWGCMRLASRILGLRKAGVKVKTRWVRKNGKRWTEYRV